jgi:HEAT repeat protein
LALIKDTGEAIPLTPVTQVASADPSPELRMQALALLAKRAKAEAADPLMRALEDPDPQVRERARALLEKLGIPVADASGSDETPLEGERR